MTIDLLLLGATRIRVAGALPALAHLPPRPLALLGYLAVAEPRGLHRRDKLVSLLWPEYDQQRARSAMRQALVVLRGTLGRDLLHAAGTEEIGLADDSIRTDVEAFRQAVLGGRWDEGIRLFGGPLLDGLLVVQAHEFMDWLDRVRGRLLRGYTRCLEGAALVQEQSARWDDALEWWCRLVELEPCNVRIAAALIRCQAAGGDPAGALRRADECVQRVKAEAGVDPAPELQSAFADGCRTWRMSRRPA